MPDYVTPDPDDLFDLIEWITLRVEGWLGIAPPWYVSNRYGIERIVRRYILHYNDFAPRWYVHLPELGVSIEEDLLPIPFRLTYINEMLAVWGKPTQDLWTNHYFADYLNDPSHIWPGHPLFPPTPVTIANVLFWPAYAMTGLVVFNTLKLRAVGMLTDAYNVENGGAGGEV